MKFTFILSALLFGRALGLNVVEVAVGAPSLFSELVDLVLTAGLDEALSTTGDITVFAPTDDAFGKLHASSLNLLKTEPWRNHLENLLLQHVLSMEVPSSDITDGLTAPALNGEDVKLNLPEGGGVVVNDSSNVVQADVEADNGVIHAVDTVLFPEWVHKNLYQRASGDNDLSTLVQLINGLHLAHALSFNGPYTVFAPTNDAFFEGLTLLGEDDGVIDYHLASNLLTYHVVYGIYSKKDIEDGLELTTAQGERIRFSFNGDTPQVNGENIITADVLANNGIVHVIDGLLIPDSVTPTPLGSVVDVALDNNDTFSSLVEFIAKADLVTALAQTEGITVFAPTNDAFAALAGAAPSVVANLQTEEWVTHLEDVLLYHVLGNEVPSSAVTDGLTATALNGEVLSFSVNANGIFVNTESEVILADVDASNGVIHAIDNVLLPSWVTNNIVQRADASPILTNLVALVLETGLDSVLSGDGPFTVFAPTDDAFAEFLNGADPSENPEMVATILAYHVVPGIHTESEIGNGMTLKTVQEENLTFSVMGKTKMVNGEAIVATNILANNGVVHVIDGVLIPEEATASVMMEAAVASQRSNGNVGGNTNTNANIMAMLDSEQASSASFYRATFAAATTALVGFGVVIGAVF